MFEIPEPSDPPESSSPVGLDSDPPAASLPVDPASLATAQIEADLCCLAGQIAAATCRFLVLLGEFDARDGWGGPGLRSCAHWLSWRCGLSLGSAREHVRVAKALRDLPLVAEVFAGGRLSYSKVRAVTRIATSDTEADLVHLALSTTAAQLDRVVGEYRTADARAHRRTGLPARSFTWSWCDDGSLTIRGRLAAEEGVLLLAAVDAMRHRLDGKPDPTPTDNDTDCQRDDGARRRSEDAATGDVDAEAYRSDNADALIALATAGLHTGPLDTSGSDRFEVVVHADISDFIDTEAAPADPPANHTEPTEPTEPTESDGQPEQVESAGQPEATESPAPVGHTETTPHPPRRGRSALARGRCHLRNGPCLHPDTLHRLACDTALRVMIHGEDGSPRDVSDRRRTVTPHQRRLLEQRDGGCRFPSCARKKHLHAHHIQYWSRGGPTDLDNLVLLCGFHHRLLHHHGYTIVRADRQMMFCGPDGTRIEDSPPVTDDGRIAEAIRDKPTGPEPLTPTWGGEALDLGYIISVLMQRMPDTYAA